METTRKIKSQAGESQPKSCTLIARRFKCAPDRRASEHHLNVAGRKQVRDQLRYMADLLAHVNDAIVASDVNYRLTAWNAAAEAMYGWKAEEVLGRNGLEIIQTQFPDAEKESMLKTIAATGYYCGEATQVRKDGTRFPVEVNSILLRDAHGCIRGYLSVNRDITERKQSEIALQQAYEDLRRRLAEIEMLQEQLRAQAISDHLTGLFNRRYLQETLEREVARARREGQPVGIIIMDTDYFKCINDTYGHTAGDRVLQAVGILIKNNVRMEDIACRYGGEEFVIVMPGASLVITQERARLIHERIAELRVLHEGEELQVTVSVGVAVFPLHSASDEEVLIRADRALYQAKQNGRNQVVVYQENMQPDALRNWIRDNLSPPRV